MPVELDRAPSALPLCPDELHSRRMDLRPLDADALDALAAGDQTRLEAAAGAQFPRPLLPLEHFADYLDLFREQMRRPRPEDVWWFWALVVRGAGEAAGIVGLPGGPDDAGRLSVGYAVYPPHRGRGYASEAVEAVVAWALRQPGIMAVRATVGVGNAASLRVATKAGMRAVGAGRDAVEGQVVRFERRRVSA